jgi:hypothetical protein
MEIHTIPFRANVEGVDELERVFVQTLRAKNGAWPSVAEGVSRDERGHDDRAQRTHFPAARLHTMTAAFATPSTAWNGLRCPEKATY